ncbi:MAG: ATP-binding cassette domain-containing protein, partial [Planctomycetia bacterium]
MIRPSAVPSSYETMPAILTAEGREPVVSVAGLDHHFGEDETRTQVLFDVNLAVEPGELVIVKGPSGCGKTTLLTLLGGLRRVQQGEVTVLGRAVHALSDRELVGLRRGIGFIFQAHNLFRSLTAFENVRMALELQNTTKAQIKERAEELLDHLGLADHRHKKADKLSGGQKQRVAIARALANRPKLVLADEPTAALDSKSADVVLQLLRRMAEAEGCTSLIVTHDQSIMNSADRVVQFQKGRIAFNALVHETTALCERMSQSPIFSGLQCTVDLSPMLEVARRMRRERHAARSLIVRQGEVGDRFYLIAEGKVEVYSDGLSGRRRLAVLGPGEVFGEAALISGNPRNATVQALDDAVVFSLDKAHFDEVRTHHAS